MTCKAVTNSQGQVLMRHRLCGTVRWLLLDPVPTAVTFDSFDAKDPGTGQFAFCSYCSGSFLHSNYWTLLYQAEEVTP